MPRTAVLAVLQLPDKYRADAKSYARATAAQRAALVDWLADTPEPILEDETLLRLSRATGLNGEVLAGHCAVLLFSLRALERFGDTPDAYVSDLTDLGILAEEEGAILNEDLKRLLATAAARPGPTEAFEAVFPVVERVKARCVFLPRFGPDHQTSNDKRSYHADVQALVPAVVLRLDQDGPGEEDSASFLLTERALRLLADALDVARRQLEIAKVQVQLSSRRGLP